MPGYRILTVLAAAMILVPTLAPAWRALNRHEVNPVGGGVYEVIGRVGSGAQDYWCAIGDYAISQLGAAAAQRIFVWRPVGPSVTRPGRRAVQFALSPPKGADTSSNYALTVRRAGENLLAAAAQQYCYDNRFDDFDFWLGWR